MPKTKPTTSDQDASKGSTMEARASARYVRVAPMKARRLVDVIRGMPAGEAVARLRFAPQAASVPVLKVIESALANAEQKGAGDRDDLVITSAYVDEGPTLKRFRPRAQGRAYRIRKRTSHITVVVTPVDKPAPTGRSAATNRGGRGAQRTTTKGAAR